MVPSLVDRRSPHFNKQVLDGMFNDLLKEQPTPDLYSAPCSVAEVCEAVKYACIHHQQIAVRSGGCSWIGASCRSQGMLIDMKHFSTVDINEAKGIALVGPAVRGNDLGKQLAAYGFAFPLGHCGRPAVGGYLLGGGLGLNWGAWKPACYSVRAIDLVAPEGKILHADETENSEWLWMARGMGPAFPGIITRYELALRKYPNATRVSRYVFDYSHADKVSKWLTDISCQMQSNVELVLVAMGPDREFLTVQDGFPTHLVVITGIAYMDTVEEARHALSLLSRAPIAPLMAIEMMEVPFEKIHELIDVCFPEQHRYAVDSFWSRESTDTILPLLSQSVYRAPSGKNFIMVIMPGNGSSNLYLDAKIGSYSTDFKTVVLSYAVWNSPEQDQANIDWTKGVGRAMEDIIAGHFINETDLIRQPSRIRNSFSEEAFNKITSYKSRLDPHNRFWFYP